MTAIRRSPEFGGRKCLEASGDDELLRSPRHRPGPQQGKCSALAQDSGPAGGGTGTGSVARRDPSLGWPMPGHASLQACTRLTSNTEIATAVRLRSASKVTSRNQE